MTLQDLLRLMLRQWVVLAVALVVGGVAGFLYEARQPDVVATSGRLLIGPALEAGFDVVDSTGSLSRGTVQQTLAEIATGSAVTQSARASVDNRSSAYAVTSVVVPETNVIQIRVTGPDSDAAVGLALAIMSEAESSFETLYPVYDITTIDEPGKARQIAPNPTLGLLLGAVAGAGLATIGVAARDATARRRVRAVQRRVAAGTGDPIAGGPLPFE